MNAINNLLKTNLKKTFTNYFKHSIEHLVNTKQTENDVLQVIINIQASLELLSKLYILNMDGWEKITSERFHKQSEEELKKHILNGTLKTIQYTDIKNILLNYITLDQSDLELLDKFQNYRNQIMHLGIEKLDFNILDQAIWLIVRILNILNWQDILPHDYHYLTNSLEYLLGNELYTKLINQSKYVEEAINSACVNFYEVRYCLICKNNTLVLNDLENEYNCLVCGCKILNDKSIEYVDCPLCNRMGTVIYDALNISINNYINGFCCACRENISLVQCKSCKETYIYETSCNYCSEINDNKT
ncbi:hypothetical protein [Aliarcobacter butzleri]|uniref:hypothetical protein n=1 Tax=Aliarcobacter butzleri TaxID=28197 RepID=UPI00215A32DD|nr:hypothetical protein [Aliarcobacter butzleri]MCR8710977.1 hypothetical protein [Aliarcobacter butzleri]